MRGSWIRHRKLARLWWLRPEAKVCSAVILGDWRLGRGRFVWNYVDDGKLGELHSCAGLQMPLGRAVLTAHWLGVAAGWLWELLWRGGDWLALGAALAGWQLAGSGSCSGGGGDYKAARELGILDR